MRPCFLAPVTIGALSAPVALPAETAAAAAAVRDAPAEPSPWRYEEMARSRCGLPVTFAIVVGILTVNVWTPAARAPTPQDAKQGDAESAEDRKVLTAVIDHTIRPAVQRLTRLGPSAFLFIIKDTAAACDRFRSPRTQPFCMAGVEGLRNGQAIGSVGMAVGPVPAEAIPSAAHRAELIASIGARNTDRRVIPVSEELDIKLVEAPPVTNTPAGGTSTSYTVFSLPGYSSAGHAVVYGFYDCGGRCGTAWLWLLEKRGAAWQVRSRYVLGMF